MPFKIGQNQQVLSYFCENFGHRELSKITQSRHTGGSADGLRNTKICISLTVLGIIARQEFVRITRRRNVSLRRHNRAQ